MIKRNSTAVLLVGLLGLSVLISAGLCYQYVRTLTYLLQLQVTGQRLQNQFTVASRNRDTVQRMAGEAIAYSKRNPAIDPLLVKFDLKPKSGEPGAAKPSSR